jgi:hypothetical protein
MQGVLGRRLSVVLVVGLPLFAASCQGGKRFYPVRGQVFANGQPAEGVTVTLHGSDIDHEQPLQPTATVMADGSFELRTFVLDQRVVKEGAPAGEYKVTCVWYPPDLEKYFGRSETLPDKLKGRYGNARTTELRAEVREEPTELPPFKLEISN